MLPAWRDWGGRAGIVKKCSEVWKLSSESTQDMSWLPPPRALSWDGQSFPHFTDTPKAQGCSGPLPKLPWPQVLAWEGKGETGFPPGAELPWFWEDSKISLNTQSWMGPTRINSSSSVNGPSRGQSVPSVLLAPCSDQPSQSGGQELGLSQCALRKLQFSPGFLELRWQKMLSHPAGHRLEAGKALGEARQGTGLLLVLFWGFLHVQEIHSIIKSTPRGDFSCPNPCGTVPGSRRIPGS